MKSSSSSVSSLPKLPKVISWAFRSPRVLSSFTERSLTIVRKSRSRRTAIIVVHPSTGAGRECFRKSHREENLLWIRYQSVVLLIPAGWSTLLPCPARYSDSFDLNGLPRRRVLRWSVRSASRSSVGFVFRQFRIIILHLLLGKIKRPRLSRWDGAGV